MAKLSTPQNVSISGSVLSFSPVEHATGYAIFAGSTEIGSYGATNTYLIDIVADSSLSVQFAPYTGETTSYDAVSGWTLYDGDKITVIKSGSTRRLYVNGVAYVADNTINEITITNENVEIWTEAGSDASGDNYAKVVITFKAVPTRLRGGSTLITAAYLGSVKLAQIYQGTDPKMGLKGTDTYYITHDLENTEFVDHVSGATVAAPTSITTDGAWISAYLKQTDTTHYGKPVLSIAPTGAVNYTYNNTNSPAILNMRAPRGNFKITAVSTAIEYLVTANGTNCTITGPTKISYQGTATYTVTLDESIYELPDTVTVTGAVGNWDKASKTLTISSPTGPTTGNPQGDVTISIVATNIQYSFTENLTNCYTEDQARDKCYAGMTFFRDYKVKNTGYAFPTSITVTNATYEWTAGSGSLKISNPTGPVTVTIAAVAKTFNYRFTNNYCTFYDSTGTTIITAGGTFKAGQTLTFTVKPYDHYKLTSDSVSVTNATIESWNATTGKITIKDPVTDDGTNTVMITATAVVSEHYFNVTNLNCTPTPANGYVSTGSTTTSVSFIPEDNFLMSQSSFTVTNATMDVQIGGSGELAIVRLSNATGTVSLKATANRVSYPLTLTGTHCTLTADKDYVSISTATTRIKVVPDADYKVNGVAGLVLGGINTYSTETVDGVFYILVSSATANASVKYTCVEDTVAIPAGMYQFKENPTLANLPALDSFSFDARNSAIEWFEFTNMTVTTNTITYVRSAGNIAAYNGSTWGKTYYRTLRLNSAQTVIRSFYTWFMANVVTSATVTYSLTNCTADSSNPTSVTIGGSADFKFHAATGYELSATPTVTGATLASWDYPDADDKSTMIAGIENVTGAVTITVVGSLPKLDTPTGLSISGNTLSFNAVTNAETYEVFAGGTSLGSFDAPVTYPVKGDLITLDSKQYRVLKTNGSVAEVLAMYDASTSQKFDSNSSYNNTYAGKNIDTYCNSTFYSGLSASMKNAIVDKTFTQDSWSRAISVPTPSHYTGKDTDGDLYYLVLANATYGKSITRHCYCLSVQDVLDYLECTTSMGTSDTTLTGTNLFQMLWNMTTSQNGKYIWLRSASSGHSRYVFYVSGSHGYLDHLNVDDTNAVRPAFQIDLSKIEWTKQ